MKKILAAGFFIALFHSGFTQTGIVKGVVTDAVTKETLIGANVFNLNDRTNGSSTDIDGKFEFKSMVGIQQIVVSYTGMESDTFRINVSADQPTVLEIKMKLLVEELGEVVFSSGRFQQKIEEITQSMEVIKPSLVENKNTRNISTALEQTPGLTVYDSEPQIRGGSGFTFGVGTRVGVYVDDLPMLLGDAGKPEWGFIPTENLEQVEVVKGASSVLFGSGALSGVINIRTAYPKEKPETRINLFTGFYSSPETDSMNAGQRFANFFGMDMQKPNGKKWWSGSANFSGLNFFHSQRIKQWDLVFGGSFQYDHNYIGPWDVKGVYRFPAGDVPDTLSNSDVSDKKGRLNFKLRRRSKKNEGLAYGINGNFMRTHTNFSLIWNNDSSGLYRSYPGTMTLQEIFTFYVDPFFTYVRPSGTKHYLRSRLYYADNENSNNQSNKSLVTYAEYQFQKNFMFIEDFNMTAGIMGQHTNSSSTLYVGTGSGDNQASNAAAYTQLDKKFWKVFNISLGLRYEFFQINNQEVVTKPVFRTGMSLKLAKATYLRASYGQGYRFPTIAERFIVTSAGGIKIFANPNLQPETSWNGEIGLKQGMKIGGFYGYFDVVGFWQEYHNAMEYVMGHWGNLSSSNEDMIGFKFLNTGDTRIRGIELSVAGKGKLTKDISMSILAGYTLIDPRMLNPDNVFAYDTIQQIGIDSTFAIPLTYRKTSSDSSGILKYRSRHQFKADIEFEYKKFALGFSARYYSHIDNIDKEFYNLDKNKEIAPGVFLPNSADLPSGITNYRATHTKGNWVMDARISCQVSQRSKIAFVVSNLANRQYSLRPLKMEAPRSVAIQYTLSL
ncbi:MAG: TonB-dependent receptor [Bacteroidia bacterium]|nr:TonB-dependent receptor [Bacteroidia bacterium]